MRSEGPSAFKNAGGPAHLCIRQVAAFPVRAAMTRSQLNGGELVPAASGPRHAAFVARCRAAAQRRRFLRSRARCRLDERGLR